MGVNMNTIIKLQTGLDIVLFSNLVYFKILMQTKIFLPCAIFAV